MDWVRRREANPTPMPYLFQGKFKTQSPLHLLCRVDKTHPLGLGEAGTCRNEFKLSSLFLVYKPYLSSFKFKVLNCKEF